MSTTDWPEPEVRARPAEPDEIPRGAKSIIALAEKHGWKWAASYARGTHPITTNNWTPGKVVDSLRLVARKEDLRVSALWIDNSFTYCWVWSHTKTDITKVNSGDLRRVLTGELE